MAARRTQSQHAAAFLAALLALLLLLPVVTRASSLRSDVLPLIPEAAGQVGFIDLRELRASPHYAAIKQRLLPSRFVHFERFIRAVGVDVDNDVEWLAWFLLPPGKDQPGEAFVGLAQGYFSSIQVETYFAENNLPVDELLGQKLFPFARGGGPQNLHFLFLDNTTAAFGTRASLRLLLETRFGERETLLTNKELYGKIEQVNGYLPIWVVLDQHFTRLAVRQLLPEAAKFEQFDAAARRFQAARLTLSVGRDLFLRFEAWCAEPADAQVFALLLTTGFAAESWRLQNSNPGLSALYGHTNVSSNRDLVEVTLDVPEAALALLLQSRQLF